MNITEKLLEARKMIKETKVEKKGRNKFSNYDYFTPSQVSELVNDVCQKLRILPLFALKKDKYGLYGQLELIDIDVDREQAKDKAYGIFTIMRTEMPVITATNASQQMGGCETYTKRYMLMSAFDITDNNLDFDSQDNRPKATTEPPKSDSKPQSLGEDEIGLNITMSGSMKELTEIWGKLTTAEKTKYGEQFTKRKIEISVKK